MMFYNLFCPLFSRDRFRFVKVLGNRFYLGVVFSAIILNSCFFENNNDPGLALVSFDFNGEVNNKGLATIQLENVDYYQFESGVQDSCLDLSGLSKFRRPLVFSFSEGEDLADYQGFTVELWAKKMANDVERYVIAGAKEETSNGFLGWEIASEPDGSWSWSFSNGNEIWRYKPTAFAKKFNNNRWHQIVFSLDLIRQEARLFYDGDNVAVYSLHDVNKVCGLCPFYIGADPLALDKQMETFNGYIDGFQMWSRPLRNVEVSSTYRKVSGEWVQEAAAADKEITVMAWNIWHGGKHQGKEVGVQRVIDIIREAQVDVALLQETYGSGEKIADALGFYYFQRSSNLSVISRFPFLESYDSFRPFNFGCVNIHLGHNREVLFCPIWLDYMPNTGAYVKSGLAIPDTIIYRELQTRGREMRFILGELASFSQNNDRAIIVGGDFNSGSHLDWTERNKSNYYDLVVEYPVSKQMLVAGYTDSYREVYPDETDMLGQTWSPVFKNAMQDRIDYIYYKGSGLSPVSSHVVDTHSLGFPSDHAAVVTVFGLK